MTLPSAGNQISFADINVALNREYNAQIGLDEAENGSYGAINNCASPRPRAGNPAAISEWWGYDHAASATPFIVDYDSSTVNCATACSLPLAGEGTIYEARGLYWTSIMCAGSAPTRYYANSSRTTCYYIDSGQLISSETCTTTTTTTTPPPCVGTGGFCNFDTDCCNYPSEVCNPDNTCGIPV